ncbi:MAG: TraR/DksA C4-type zinc finger protein [Syntrophaceticus sp.]|nr:TraR/DksA C4-type zinc finger protein [Syntrophaceticus sp.]MDD3314906.1 TraR/DksA C4-type zinc finger protein [Syntrophaceticus sp.]MDD4359393.1 TraR/DksA C4-type zinc finger protein [Syntrophaceticus sp.]MDD4782482.1 TraR/DksA C4-type zinc finger protein [Syntrophaceticus sp.]
MEQDKLAHFRWLLRGEKRRILDNLSTLEEAEEIGSLKDTLQELSMYDNHPADIGTETFERSKDIGYKDLFQRQFKQVKDAMGRIKEGNYGICEGCGQEIPEERLEAVPFTTFCYQCRQKLDDQVTASRRPVEEGVVMPPFGGFAEDRLNTQHEVQFDGEDAWQAVEHYGTSSDFENRNEEEGTVEDVEGISVYKDEEGNLYQDLRGKDDEGPPGEP